MVECKKVRWTVKCSEEVVNEFIKLGSLPCVNLNCLKILLWLFKILKNLTFEGDNVYYYQSF